VKNYMKNLIFKEDNKFSTTAMVILTSVCVLASVFAVIGIVHAANPGDRCSINADCGAGMDCIYNTCLKNIFSPCSYFSECAGSATNLMGCFSGQCLGRNAYPCGDYREDPICAPSFHCDISNPGYHYCEGDHEEPAPTCSISANPTSILNGQYSTLNWTSQNATSCTASNAWSGAKSLSGTQSVSPSSYSTYTLTCTGAGGSVDCSASVSVNPANLSCSLAANPNSGTAPLNNVDLTATVLGTATGTINYTFYCNRADSGINITYPYAHKEDGTNQNPYTAVDVCSYSSGGAYTGKVIVERGGLAAECRTPITVADNPAPTCSISANPSTILNGQSSTLSWTSQNATSCTASNAWSGAKSLSGTQSIFIFYLCFNLYWCWRNS
jgi:hypothetical protein